MLAVVMVGAVVWRRDPVVRFFGVLGLVAAVLSLGVGNGYWAPWRLFIHLPVLNNVVPVNITVIVDTCVAIVLAVIIGHVRERTRSRLGDDGATVACAAVAALALVPIAVALWPNIPMTVRPVVVPRWFASAAPRLGRPPGGAPLSCRPGRDPVLDGLAGDGGDELSRWWGAVDQGSPRPAPDRRLPGSTSWPQRPSPCRRHRCPRLPTSAPSARP